MVTFHGFLLYGQSLPCWKVLINIDTRAEKSVDFFKNIQKTNFLLFPRD